MACACGCGQRQAGSYSSSASALSSEFRRMRVVRFNRQPMIPVGALRGVIYQARRTPGEAPKTYVHFFKKRQLPTLVTNRKGSRLAIVGGQYRITKRGIQG